MNESYTILLLINSILLIILILNQNDNTKDSMLNQTGSSSMNPFETITWVSFFFQCSLLLIKIKNHLF